MSVVLRSAKEADIVHFSTTVVTNKWYFVKGGDTFKVNPGY
jgi:hypothetical protein